MADEKPRTETEHPPTEGQPSAEPVTELERSLRAGEFPVTVELVPPRTPELQPITDKLTKLKGIAKAINITDNASATVRMSSLGVCKCVVDSGMEPILQTTCRDRNRLALQSDLLSAAAFGIRNIFCVTGDYITMGDHPQAKPVFDLDSVHLLQIVTGMTKRGQLASGVEIRRTAKTPVVCPPFFIGAGINPFADPVKVHAFRLKKKALAGAQFIQTQCIFDVPRFREFMKIYMDEGLAEKLYLLAGIMPVRSHRPMEYMMENVPGMRIPSAMIERMKAAEDAKAEGFKLAAELIQEVRQVPGVVGIHLMTVGWEDVIPDLLKESLPDLYGGQQAAES